MATRLFDVGLLPKHFSPRMSEATKTRTIINPKRSGPFCNINSNSTWINLQFSLQLSKNFQPVICRAAREVKSRKSSSKNISSNQNSAAAGVGFSQGRDEDADRFICPGCGVYMQDKNPEAPGFFVRPAHIAALENLETLGADEQEVEDELSAAEEEGGDEFSEQRERVYEFSGQKEEEEEEMDEEEWEKILNKLEQVVGPEYDEFKEETLDVSVSKDNKKRIKGGPVEEEEVDMMDEFIEEEEETLNVKVSKTDKKKNVNEKKATLEILEDDDDKEDEIFEEEKWNKNPKGRGFEDETLNLSVPKKGSKKKIKAEREERELNEFSEEFGEDTGKRNEDDQDWSWMPSNDEEEEKWKKNLDGFMPAGPGYGNVTEETLKARALKREKRKKTKTEQKEKEKQEKVVVCARCHSLRHYGDVKDKKTENLLPEFDFESAVGSRLKKSSGIGRTVVVMVVDAVDFDGSFPRGAAKMLNNAYGLRLVLVATKVDLLPAQISPARLDRWVRNRAREAGAPKLNGVFLVSSYKDLGVRNLIARIKDLAGPRGNVWVIGVQNAGKSSLINAIGKKAGGKVTHLTEAAVPGTTLGILRIGGIFPAKAKLYDTPGLLQPYQITMRLNREEQKMIEIRRELKPRTYRAKVGQTIHIGGLMRLDVDQASVETIYVTVWASVHVSLHMGKLETANEIKEKHFGVELQPPIGQARVRELGEWKQTKIEVKGNSWDANSVDVAAAGLGWFSVAIKGDASLSIWTYDGVDITVREPLVLDRASFLERPGFLLSTSVIKSISQKSKISDKKATKSKKINIDDLSTEMLEEELSNV